MSDADPVTAPDAEPRLASRRTVVLVVLAIALVAVAGLGLRWWTHPTVFPTGGAAMGFDPRPLAQSSEAIGVTFPAVHATGVADVTLGSARARFRVNTAEATASFWVCRQSPGEAPIAAAAADDTYCKQLRPFTAGDTFRYGPPGRSDYLVVVLSPTQPGRVVMNGVDLSYSLGADHLFQRGTQTIHVQVKLTAR